MDWQTIWPVVAFGVGQLLALAGAYYGLKADNAKLAADLSLSMLAEKSERREGQTAVKNDLTVLINAVDFAVKDLSKRVSSIESGDAGWTKALRERTHELANHMHDLMLKVDRLDRTKKES